MRKKTTIHKAKHIRETKNPSKNLSGFTLLEALIALLVLSIGLLGLAALQANALKLNHGAYNRTQATFLVQDMMDRLRANRIAAQEGRCNVGMGDQITGGGLCQADVNDWQVSFVRNFLPEGEGKIDCATETEVCTIEVQWDISREGGSVIDGSNIANFEITAFL